MATIHKILFIMLDFKKSWIFRAWIEHHAMTAAVAGDVVCMVSASGCHGVCVCLVNFMTLCRAVLVVITLGLTSKLLARNSRLRNISVCLGCCAFIR